MTSKDTKRDDQDSCVPADGGSAEFDRLLHAIESEPVPERLLSLAQELQAALVQKRLAEREATLGDIQIVENKLS